MRIIATSSTVELTDKICSHLQITRTEHNFKQFSDKEISVDIGSTVRNKDVYIVSSISTSDDLIELLLLVNAARSACAKTVNVVFAYYGYARQDRKDQQRGAIGAKMVANCLEGNGVDHVVILDSHFNQIQGFFKRSSDLLHGSKFFADHMKNSIRPDTVIVAPDLGASKRARDFSKLLGNLPIAIIDKRRDKPNSISEMVILGDIKNKHCIIIDDIIDTAGTICKAAEMLIEEGALSVSAAITHPVLSGPAIERINSSKIEKLWISDSIKKDMLPNNAEVITCSKLLSKTVLNIFNSISIHLSL